MTETCSVTSLLLNALGGMHFSGCNVFPPDSPRTGFARFPCRQAQSGDSSLGGACLENFWPCSAMFHKFLWENRPASGIAGGWWFLFFTNSKPLPLGIPSWYPFLVSLLGIPSWYPLVKIAPNLGGQDGQDGQAITGRPAINSNHLVTYRR